MSNEFGDIDLFREALAADRLDPPVDDYLRSTGLSEADVVEVRSLYRKFCSAIENSATADLPDLAGGSQSNSTTAEVS